MHAFAVKLKAPPQTAATPNAAQSREVRAVLRSQQQPETEKARLKRLVADVKSTGIGKKFLSIGGGDPDVVWGDTGDFDGNWDGTVITLNEAKQSVLSDCEWKQVIAMELGNFAHERQFAPILNDCEKGNLSEDDFVNGIEKLEFESRNDVIAAYTAGEFGAGPQRFKTMDFPAYLTANKAHVDSYRENWRESCQKKYKKKHP